MKMIDLHYFIVSALKEMDMRLFIIYQWKELVKLELEAE